MGDDEAAEVDVGRAARVARWAALELRARAAEGAAVEALDLAAARLGGLAAALVQLEEAARTVEALEAAVAGLVDRLAAATARVERAAAAVERVERAAAVGGPASGLYAAWPLEGYSRPDDQPRRAAS